MNPTQIQTTLAPIVSFIAGVLAVKLSFFDTATWGSILSGVVGLIGVVWGAIAARKTALITTTANLSEVKQVTLDASASKAAGINDATPANVVVK